MYLPKQRHFVRPEGTLQVPVKIGRHVRSPLETAGERSNMRAGSNVGKQLKIGSPEQSPAGTVKAPRREMEEVMARYFFNVRDDAGKVHDKEGIDLPDIRAARAEAETAAREMIAEMVLRGVPIDHGIFEVCDEERNVLFKLPFREVLDMDSTSEN